MSLDLTQTKVSGPPDPQSGKIDLDPSKLLELVKHFTTAQEALAKIKNDLQNTLVANRGALVWDDSAYKFRLFYGRGLGSLLKGIVRIHSLFGKIGDALCRTAQNHQKAGSGSKEGGDSPPPAQAQPISAPDYPDLPNIAEGNTDSVSAKVQQYWPWCHNEIIDRIAPAYNNAAKSLEDLLRELYSNVQKTTQDNVSEDLSQFASYFNPIARPTLVSDLPNLARDLGAAVQGYRGLVWERIEPFKAAAKKAYEDLGWGPDWSSKDGRELLIAGSGAWLGGYSQDDIGQKAVDEHTIINLSNSLTNEVANSEWISSLTARYETVDGEIGNLKDPGAATSDTTQPNDPHANDHDRGEKPTSPPPRKGSGVPSGLGSMGAGYMGAGSKTGDPGKKSGDDPGKKPGGDTGNINPSPIIDDGQAKRAKDKLDKLSPENRQRFEQLLHNAKSPQEQAYLMKDLAAGHSVDEIANFDNLIHNHGDDPAWLQEHLTPMTNGDAQNPDFTYQGASWTQGQYPAAVAASTVLARAAVDPSYALKLTTGNKPGDPSSTSKDAFLERLRQEEQNVYDQGSTGGDGTSEPSQAATSYPGNTPGPGDNQGQQISSGNGGTSGGQNYDGQNNQYQDVGSSAADHREILANVHRALDEGKPVPIQAQSADSSNQMVIVGYRGDQLEVYKPPGEITWISENDLVSGTMDPGGGGVRSPGMTTT